MCYDLQGLDLQGILFFDDTILPKRLPGRFFFFASLFLFQVSRPDFLAFFTAKVEFCLGSMKVYPDRLQSKHKRPTIWGTGHRGPFFVGHFINPGDIRAFCLSVSCSLTLPGQIVGQGAKLWSIFCIFPFGEICIFCLISASLSPYFFSLCQIGI